MQGKRVASSSGSFSARPLGALLIYSSELTGCYGDQRGTGISIVLRRRAITYKTAMPAYWSKKGAGSEFALSRAGAIRSGASFLGVLTRVLTG
jgi:hypothetical protein